MAGQPHEAMPEVHPLSGPGGITVEEYQAMGEDGSFGVWEEHRVELIDGEILRLMGTGPEHGWAVAFLTDWLVEHARPAGLRAWVQTDVVAGPRSQPVPDLALVRRDEPRSRLPAQPLLVIEVARTSLRHDRLRKAGVYALAGVADYWIVNLVDEQVEVSRDPVAGTYRSHEVVRAGACVAPLALPAAPLDVEALLVDALGR